MDKLIDLIHIKWVKNYVFKQKDEYYIVSTNKGTITSVYATGKGVKVSPLKIGESSSHILKILVLIQNQLSKRKVKLINLKCLMKI